ncbi:MAG: DUF4349 domain-containing protein [Chloroflexi bacterium]|nr:DUF4349 domain-containing protein [Chloroflexota bacterium]
MTRLGHLVIAIALLAVLVAAFPVEAQLAVSANDNKVVNDNGVVKAVEAARSAVVAGGGYIGASRQATTDDGVVATVTYRIPVERWEQTLSKIRGLSIEVLDERTEALEVTGQVVDLEARIRNLQAAERAMQGIAERTTEIKDVLTVQGELTRLRGEIEQLTAQRNELTDRAAFGTMAVTFGVEIVAVSEAAKGWDATTEVDRAAATLVNVLQALATAGIWFGIVWLPILLFLSVLALAGRSVIVRSGLVPRRSGGGGRPA